MRPDTAKWLNLVQIVVEILVAAGFFCGLIPFVYLWSSGWVVPLTLVSAALALITGNGTLTGTCLNIVFAFVSFIPLLGFVTRLLGIVVSLLNIAALRRRV